MMHLVAQALLAICCLRQIPTPTSDYELPQLYTMPSDRVFEYAHNLSEEIIADLDRVGANPEPASFENTILPLDRIFYKQASAECACRHLANDNTSEEVFRYAWMEIVNSIGSCNRDVYRRVRIVILSLPKGDEKHRVALACEALLRHHCLALSLWEASRFRELQERIFAIREAAIAPGVTEVNADFIRLLIAARTEMVQFLQKHNDFACRTLSEACPGAHWSINLSCAGTFEEIESALMSMSETFKNIGLTRFQGVPGVDSEAWDWCDYQQSVTSRLSSLHDNRWELKDVVWNGLFFVVEKLYGLRAQQQSDIHVLHSDVMVFELLEEDGTPLGLLFLDLITRPGKAVSVSNIPLVYRSTDSNMKRAAATITMSLPSPSHRLTIIQVFTLFHEFGHALHCLFSDTKYFLLSSGMSPLDWVEFPSHLHEMWATDSQVLHSIDPSLTDSDVRTIQDEFRVLVAIDKFYSFYNAIRTLYWNRISPAPENFEEFSRSLQERYGLGLLCPSERILGPLFLVDPNLTSPEYYGYAYSWRIARSAQEWVISNGGLCREVGEQLRRKVLSKGISVPYENMTDLFYDTHRHVALLEDLGQLSVHLS